MQKSKLLVLVRQLLGILVGVPEGCERLRARSRVDVGDGDVREAALPQHRVVGLAAAQYEDPHAAVEYTGA